MNGLKSMRIKKGLTQEGLAGLLNVNNSAVSNWETGIAKPTADKLPELAKILQCSIDELFDEY